MLKRTLGIALVALGLGASPWLLKTTPQTSVLEAAAPDRIVLKPEIDVAICLDCSGSMEALINLTREKIWSMVNEFNNVRPKPNLRVALLTFGSEGKEEDGWVVVKSELTNDLDKVSEELFKLRTHGGEEYVGRVVNKSLEGLKWSEHKKAMRVIFVAGNESADQDQKCKSVEVAKLAKEKGMIVNAFFCGNPQAQEALGWSAVAMAGGGSYHAINMEERVAVATPFDEKIVALNGNLNKTYIAFGAKGDYAIKNQQAQDNNSANLSKEAEVQRACSKAGGCYNNSSWDLIDAMDSKDFDFSKVKKEDLPKELQDKSTDELKKYVEEKKTERMNIQKEITELSKKRQEYVDEELKKLGKEDKVGNALKSCIRGQANACEIKFEDQYTKDELKALEDALKKLEEEEAKASGK